MKPKIGLYTLFKKLHLIIRIKMAYYTSKELGSMNFKKIGDNVKISKQVSIYDYEKIEIGDNSRIDDFCVISGKVNIGRNVHITPMCLVAGGEEGIIFEDFTTIAYSVQVFTQSDDYSGNTMTNSTIPARFKNEFKSEVIIKKYSIVGAGSIVMPGVTLAEGTAIGAMSLVRKCTKPWGIYAGSPAVRLKNRSKNLLNIKDEYLREINK